CVFFVFFFFQAEDGIRDLIVTGVQTCALPIWLQRRRRAAPRRTDDARRRHPSGVVSVRPRRQCDRRRASRRGARRSERLQNQGRSEERRVGKECRSRRWTEHEKKRKREAE